MMCNKINGSAHICSLSRSSCINLPEEGVSELVQRVEVVVGVEVREEVCERRHIVSSRRAARIATGGPSCRPNKIINIFFYMKQ